MSKATTSSSSSLTSSSSSSSVPMPSVSPASLPEQFQILPLILKFMQALNNPSATEAQISDACTAVFEKLAQCRSLIEVLPNTDRSLEQQKEMLAQMQTALEKRRQLLASYQQLPLLSSSAPAADCSQTSSMKVDS
eukprot:GILI01017801.1.p1 GENE.GILI01017801.1~~GILI01017801.1.p1  ORF type:complete len:148 (+),score=19.87 GILI01017801.1:39-446(+)